MTFHIEIIYLLASTGAIIAMAPQVKKLLVTRRSNELSLPSWCVWCMSQMTAVAYGISLRATAYIVINVIWLLYYVTMTCLIIKYRQRSEELVAEVDKAQPAHVYK